jgi:hypothetical protein
MDEKTTKEKLMEYITQTTDNIPYPSGQNLMGCSESWYDSFYAIKRTFTIDEIKQMTDHEVENLVRLGDSISEALY